MLPRWVGVVVLIAGIVQLTVWFSQGGMAPLIGGLGALVLGSSTIWLRNLKHD
jgi:hypothetical protein